MINKLMLVSAGAVWGFMALVPIDELSAQSKVAKNVKGNSSQVVNSKVTNSTTPKNNSKNSSRNSPTAKQTSKTGVAKAPQNKRPDTAKDLKPHIEVVAIPPSFNRSSSISISTKPDVNLVEIARTSTDIAQTGNATSNSPDIIRQQLLIRPIQPPPQNVFRQIYTPSLNAGTPAAFGLQTGDAFISVSGSTAGRARDTVDGSISLGTGLGDANQYFAVEGVFNRVFWV